MDYYKFTKEDRDEWITRTTPVTKVKASVSRTDTCYFAINTLGVTPLSWQLKLWNMIDAGKKRIAICTPRQVGKSIGVAIFALKAATMNIAPAGVNKKTMIGIVSATEEQSKKLMAEIKRLIVLGDEKVSRATNGKNKCFYSDKIDNRQIATNNKSTITFTNGNQIVCLPPTNRVRGYSFSYMFVDEAAFIEDPEIYYDSIEPTVSQTNGAIILTSTPNGQQGFFYDIFDPYEKYEHHDYSRLWIHYSELNQDVEIEKNLIDGIMLKKQNYYARGLVKHFEQEYEAKFNVQVSAFFEADQVDKLFKSKLLKEARYTGECDCAVDFGMVNSHTVVTVTHINEEGVIERLYHYQYPFGEDDQLISDLEEIRGRFNIQRFIPDDCLDWETEVIVDGKPKMLKDVKVGDKVLSYDFTREFYEYKTVLDSLDKGVKKTQRVRVRNGTSVWATKDHKFMVKHNNLKGNQFSVKYLKDVNPKRDRLAVSTFALPGKGLEINNSELYLYGIFIGEGSHHVGEGMCFLAQSKDKNPEIYDKIKWHLDNLELEYSEAKKGKGFTLFASNEINKSLQTMGTYCDNKKLPDWIYELDRYQIKILFEGLYDGDGWVDKRAYDLKGKKIKTVYGYGTTSFELAKQIKWLNLVMGRPNYISSRMPVDRIKRQYSIVWNNNSWFSKEQGVGLGQVGFDLLEEEDRHVWDINVEGNHNFVLFDSGLIVHNCAQGYHTIQKMIEKGWNVQPMSFKKDKVKKYTEFRAWLNKGKIKSYSDSVLSEEMKALQEEESKLSTLIHKPRGGTDDMIDSFVMSCYFYLEVDSYQFQTFDLNDY